MQNYIIPIIAIYFIYCLFDFLKAVISKTPSQPAVQTNLELQSKVTEPTNEKDSAKENDFENYLLYVDSEGSLIYENERMRCILRGTNEFKINGHSDSFIGFTAKYKYAKNKIRKR